ncbi:hypothetical protein ACXR0O_04070 [Verrucomicrobiota bacterium sgz303538]
MFKPLSSSLSLGFLLLGMLPGVAHADPPTGILAPATGFKPLITFRESRQDKVIAFKDPASSDLIREQDTRRNLRITLTAGLTGVDKTQFTSDTGVACQVGYFYHTAILEEDPAYTPAKTKATFPLYDGVTFDAQGEPVKKGTIVYDWSKSFLTITVQGTNIGSIIEPDWEDLFERSGTTADAPFGRFAYRNRAALYVAIASVEGTADEFFGGTVNRKPTSFPGGAAPQTFALTNFTVGRTKDVTPPLIASVTSNNGANPGLTINLTEDFPQKYKLLNVTLTPAGGTPTAQTPAGNNPYSVFAYNNTNLWTSYQANVTYGYNPHPYLRPVLTNNIQTTSTNQITLNVGDLIEVQWQTEGGATVTSRYLVK